MTHILVVDDEPAICWALREALTDDGHTATAASSAEEALDRLRDGCRPDAVILDVRLPGLDGLSAMQQIRETTGTAPIIVVTAFGNLEVAVQAIENGAFDYLLKPFNLDQVLSVVRRALQARAMADVVSEHASPPSSTEVIIGASPAAQQVFKQIALVAGSDVNVLITGESGTGKELVARAIHRHSLRRDKPLLPVCIAALNPSLVESELFGHVRGAFTGATDERRGLLELARGGTVLLDEIADVPSAVQVKLLRAIEQREVTPVGDARPRATDIRILSATNRPLPEMIADGRFREDLYFRLGGFHIHLPPLRERREDIPALAEYFLSQAVRPPIARGLRLSTAARDELLERPWPGNIRELKHALEHAAVVAREGEIGCEHLPARTAITSPASVSPVDHVRQGIAAWAANTTRLPKNAESPSLYDQFLTLAEPPLLETVLAHCGQNRAAAAELLGMHRATLRRKLRDHGIG